MSLIKANAVQIGQSGTATQNFTLAVPSSPDGTIKLARGNANATTQDVISVDASGNINGLVKSTGSTTARSLANRFADVVNVKDFGAVGDGVADDYAAFNTAINALNAEGGKIIVPSGSYKLNTEPTWGTKSLYWDISTGCVFSGTGTGFGKFPYMETNAGQMAVGPWIQSKTTQIGGSASNGGIAAFNVEMLQPSSATTMQSVAGYFASSGSSASTGANVWALNTLIRAESGAGGFYQCIEADLDVFSSTTTKTIGITIQGVGMFSPDVGLEIARTPISGQTFDNQPKYKTGINLFTSVIGIKLDQTVEKGIVIHNPDSAIQSAAISIKQRFNNADTINLQRYQDSSSSGYFLRCVNTANNVNIFTLNSEGGIDSQSYFKGTRLEMFGTAAPASAGIVSLGNDVLANSTAMPSTPPQYWYVYFGGTQYKIPLFTA
jgi:hypothetical protein